MKRILFMAVLVWFAIGGTIAAIIMFSPYPTSLLKDIMTIKANVEDKNKIPEVVKGLPTIDGQSAAKLFSDRAMFLDARADYQADTEKIPGAQVLSYEMLIQHPEYAANLDKSKTYVVYCENPCWRGPAVGLMLKQLGFKSVYWYREGLPDWESRGYATKV